MSIKKRIGIFFIMGLLGFIICSATRKLFFNETNWLINSIVFTVSYILGYLMTKSKIIKTCNNKWDFILSIGLVLFFVSAFICGIILNSQAWIGISVNLSFPFIISFAAYTYLF